MASVYAAPATVAPFLLALVLGVSGVAKLQNLSTAEDAFVSLRLPAFLLRLKAPRILPFAELVLAVALLVCSGPLAVLVAIAAVAVFIAYFVVIVRALGFPEKVTCSCFGTLGLGAVDRFTAVRNAILVALAAATLVDACHGRSVVERWTHFTGGEWLWLCGILAAVALTWLISGHRGADATPTRTGSTDDDYVRVPIPIGRLQRPDNTSVTLRALARTEPALLLYVSPTCGSCVKVIEKARTWQHETDIVRTYLVLPSPPATEIVGLPDPENFNLLFDPQSEMFNLFESATPSAVLLGADGRLAGGPVVGYGPVAGLMDDVLVELSGGEAPTRAHSDSESAATAESASVVSASSVETTTTYVGTSTVSSQHPVSADPPAERSADSDDDRLEYIRHPSPHGLLHTRDGAAVALISLADAAPTILLLVSPSCGSCHRVITATPAWRDALGAVRVAFVVNDEQAALQLEQVLGTPAGDLYLDPGMTLVATFAAATPSMVALGPDRHLLAGPVIGAPAVMEAMDEIIAEVSALPESE